MDTNEINNEKCKKYVDEVFDKFDYDHSGELSYEGLHLNVLL